MDGSSTERYAVDPRRWFILAYFAVVNCNQCLGWFTFGSLSLDTLQGYFGPRMDKGTADILLGWGPWFGMIFSPVAIWICSRPGGLRKALWSGIFFVFFGNLIRIIPILTREIGGHEGASETGWAYVCYNVGQIFIAAAGPFNMGSVTLLSRTWFPEDERNTATCIAQRSNGFGGTIGFLTPLWLSRSATSVPNTFYLGLLLSVIPIICASIYLPAQPRYSPSAAAAVDERVNFREEVGQMRQLLTNRSFCILIFSVGIYDGAMSGWQGVFQSMLGPEGISENAVGWIGFANGLAAAVFGIATGSLMDNFFHRRLKAGILTGLTLILICLSLFTLMLLKTSFLGYSNWSLALLISFVGAGNGACLPLFYELGAELMYPAKESTSGGLIVFILNAASGAMIGLNTYLTASNMNYIITSIVAILLVAILFGVKEEYKRSGSPADAKKRLVDQAPSSVHA